MPPLPAGQPHGGPATSNGNTPIQQTQLTTHASITGGSTTWWPGNFKREHTDTTDTVDHPCLKPAGQPHGGPATSNGNTPIQHTQLTTHASNRRVNHTTTYRCHNTETVQHNTERQMHLTLPKKTSVHDQAFLTASLISITSYK